MPETTVTVEVDRLGRCTIPKPARIKLGIDRQDAIVEITVRKSE